MIDSHHRIANLPKADCVWIAAGVSEVWDKTSNQDLSRVSSQSMLHMTHMG